MHCAQRSRRRDRHPSTRPSRKSSDTAPLARKCLPLQALSGRPRSTPRSWHSRSGRPRRRSTWSIFQRQDDRRRGHAQCCSRTMKFADPLESWRPQRQRPRAWQTDTFARSPDTATGHRIARAFAAPAEHNKKPSNQTASTRMLQSEWPPGTFDWTCKSWHPIRTDMQRENAAFPVLLCSRALEAPLPFVL